MPLPSHEPVESFFNPVHFIHSELRRAADSFKFHCPDSSDETWDRPLFLSMRNGSLKKRRKKKAKDSAAGLGNGRKMPQLLNDVWVPMESFLHGANGRKDGGISGMEMVDEDGDESSGSSAHCLSLAGAWWMVLGTLRPFKTAKKRSRKRDGDQDVRLDSMGLKLELDEPHGTAYAGLPDYIRSRELLQLESLLPDVIDDLVGKLSWFGNMVMHRGKECASASSSSLVGQFHTVDSVPGLSRRKKGVNAGLFRSVVGFARVGGAPVGLVDTTAAGNDESSEVTPEEGGNHEEDSVTSSTPKLANGLFNMPSNMERLRSVVSNVSNASLTELIEFIPQLGKPSCEQHPDKKKLFSVQDFFRYTEAEGKRFFEELDRDGNGQVTLEDLHVAMRKRKLPRKYARDLFRCTRRHLFSKSFGWKQFLSLIKQKDPTILQAYTTLCLSKSGTLQKNQILTSLENAGLPANEDNAIAMMRYLNADSGGSISYSHFRNFMLLLPPKRLQEDPRNIWFEAATVVAVPPPVEIPAENVLKSALAGGLASALSTSLLYPIDTMKTRVQASTLTFPEVISSLPDIGVRGLYRGSIPAIIGQFSSHGLRTGIFEASKLILINVAPGLPQIQVQSLASFCSTTLGTAVRIPCEVLKQRLQAGIFDNVREAIIGTFNHDGFRGFFRGTAATLCREVPFYVAGMGLYAEAKKVAQKLLSRELEPWETVAIGALSGGLAAVVTTPFDVMKTRMMTARPGRPVSIPLVVSSVLRHEGPLGLFKGALPRFFWIAPLGAMNFAGYELAKKAMDKPEIDDTVE